MECLQSCQWLKVSKRSVLSVYKCQYLKLNSRSVKEVKCELKASGRDVIGLRMHSAGMEVFIHSLVRHDFIFMEKNLVLTFKIIPGCSLKWWKKEDISITFMMLYSDNNDQHERWLITDKQWDRSSTWCTHNLCDLINMKKIWCYNYSVISHVQTGCLGFTNKTITKLIRNLGK